MKVVRDTLYRLRGWRDHQVVVSVYRYEHLPCGSGAIAVTADTASDLIPVLARDQAHAAERVADHVTRTLPYGLLATVNGCQYTIIGTA